MSDECLHLGRWLHAKLVSEQPAKEPIVTLSFLEVAAAGVSPYQQSVCALAKWLIEDGGEARVNREADVPGIDKGVADRLQRVEAKLPQALPLRNDPVLVPSG
jgi:hypothetical protein